MPVLAKVTDGLSAEAQRIMARGFAANQPAAAIMHDVLLATGEIVKLRTMSRRAAEYRAEASLRKEAREHMHGLVAAMKEGGVEASEMIQALATDYLVEHPETLTAADPVKVQALSLKSEELRLKRKQLEVRERAIAVLENKARLLEAREERAKAALAAPEEKLTPEERIKEIRAIYGLAS